MRVTIRLKFFVSRQNPIVSHTSQATSTFSFSDESNDANSLMSRFGIGGVSAHYQELVRHEAALHASRRWPLLAELLDAGTAHGDRS